MLQIIGNNQNKEFQKAVRYCKERRIDFQIVDTKERKLSEKEWKSIFQSLSDPMDAVDTSSQYYKKNGYAYREFDAEEEVREHVELLKMPVLRSGQKAHVGFDETFVKENA
ncbi:MAG: hypothetical protein KBS81_04455 [Spirochaetales bacterium]|nr:hypothetical protein [Candidatus Physcosoma equi]